MSKTQRTVHGKRNANNVSKRKLKVRSQ